jgi:hypothetical protein
MCSAIGKMAAIVAIAADTVSRARREGVGMCGQHTAAPNPGKGGVSARNHYKDSNKSVKNTLQLFEYPAHAQPLCFRTQNANQAD